MQLLHRFFLFFFCYSDSFPCNVRQTDRLTRDAEGDCLTPTRAAAAVAAAPGLPTAAAAAAGLAAFSEGTLVLHH